MSEIQAEESSCLTGDAHRGLSPSESSRGRHGRSGSISISSNPTTSSSEEAAHRSVRKSGRYFNPWPSWHFPSLFMLCKILMCERSNSNVPSRRELDETLPILLPDRQRLIHPPDTHLQVTWFGHSTVLVQMDGLTILTDPIFSQRASPIAVVGPKRFRSVPCTIHDLPKVHAVMISHTHYDHLDRSTVHALNARFGSELRWFVPQGLGPWMNDAGCENVMELGWWDENCIPEYPDIRFVFTPAQHWSGRHLFDRNKVTGSVASDWRFFMTESIRKANDLPCMHLPYGPFDLAAIPIGAYEPRWFMKAQHVDPEEAVQIHLDVQAKRSLGIHWGTFDLSYEFYLDPPARLLQSLQDKGLAVDDFFVMRHGEIRVIEYSTDVIE
ncbi:hypothetical protein CAPTEDRAFT_102596 [Capitella teleta]|uniref:N-acetylphosphatidylethanolamine-hydrolyzing phospholipase D n=1 Tax=Capitella teleta TaxID=283909 RepID=R7TCK8_CAPTE|nr:hypothetical protein CAPTEDRAFT_102596 [Capitella teleta]|eukprot:ELT88801.1 hypothetical protein CAPTEDRAFT_102596 [Capitella teleta]